MLFRWVICPVVAVSGRRTPKVSTIADPGIPPVATFDDNGLPIVVRKVYGHRSVVSSGRVGEENTWCLSLAWGVDLAALTLDPEIINVLSKDFLTKAEAIAILDLTPRSQGWTQGDVNRATSTLSSKGVTTTGLTLDTVFNEWLLRVADTVHPYHGGVKEL